MESQYGGQGDDEQVASPYQQNGSDFEQMRQYSDHSNQTIKALRNQHEVVYEQQQYEQLSPSAVSPTSMEANDLVSPSVQSKSIGLETISEQRVLGGQKNGFAMGTPTSQDLGYERSGSFTSGTRHMGKFRSIKGKEKENNRAIKTTMNYLKRKLTGNFSTLHQAAYDGDVDGVRRLLQQGRYINKPDKVGWTPLHVAVEEGNTEVVLELLDWGADVNVEEEEGLTPLLMASEKGHFELVEALSERGAYINAKDKSDLETALHKAVRELQYWVAKLLVDNGADVNAARKDLKSPLHFAACMGQRDLVKLLLDAGARPNAVDKDKWSPLHHAAREGQYGVVADLVAAGAEVNIKDEDSWTPLHLAAQWNQREMVIELLRHGANPQLGCGQGNRTAHDLTRVREIKLLLKDAIAGKLPPPLPFAKHSPPNAPPTPPGHERTRGMADSGNTVSQEDMEAANRQLSPQRNLRVDVNNQVPGQIPTYVPPTYPMHPPAVGNQVSAYPRQAAPPHQNHQQGPYGFPAPTPSHASPPREHDVKSPLSEHSPHKPSEFAVPAHARYNVDGEQEPDQSTPPSTHAQHHRTGHRNAHYQAFHGVGAETRGLHAGEDHQRGAHLRGRRHQVPTHEELTPTEQMQLSLQSKDLEIERLRLQVLQLQDWQQQQQLEALQGGRFNVGNELARYSFKDVAEATEGFSQAKLVGEGGFGHVYRGMMKGMEVAIKVLRENSLQGETEFKREVEVLSRVRHPHIVMLLGVCTERPSLIYELMKGSSLEDRLARLNNQAPVMWHDRVRIMLESARALQFLHTQEPQPILHRDFKPANVLLDSHLTAKLGDVGMARFATEMGGFKGGSVKTYVQDSVPVGTMAYVDPEYIQTGKYRPASDVFSFGVTLLQVITGCVDPRGIIEMVDNAAESGKPLGIMDKAAGNWPRDVAEELIVLGLNCVEQRARKRPTLETGVLLRLGEMVERIAPDVKEAGRARDHFMPALLRCPITKQLMDEPVMAADGFTYELHAIQQWMRTSNLSPMNGKPLAHLQLQSNQQVKLAIMKFRKRSPLPAGGPPPMGHPGPPAGDMGHQRGGPRDPRAHAKHGGPRDRGHHGHEKRMVPPGAIYPPADGQLPEKYHAYQPEDNEDGMGRERQGRGHHGGGGKYGVGPQELQQMYTRLDKNKPTGNIPDLAGDLSLSPRAGEEATRGYKGKGDGGEGTALGALKVKNGRAKKGMPGDDVPSDPSALLSDGLPMGQ